MKKLPENIRKTLEKIVKDMSAKENVHAIGLFGSWSRGDAEPSSDVDLLVVSEENFEEYVERIVVNDLFIDLDFIPMHCIRGTIPLELDQKLQEVQILYDRDWMLANAKLLMIKFYNSRERVDMRTQCQLIDSDIYLSRATSAFSKDDFRSALLFSTVALEKTLRVLLEIVHEPFSDSRFVEKVQASTRKLRMQELFEEYLEIAELNRLDESALNEKIRLFSAVWDEMSFTIRQKIKTLERTHFKVKNNLKYYFNPDFFKGTTHRAESLITCKKFAEASYYLRSIFLPMIENYAWLKISTKKGKLDHTRLISTLENLEKNNPRNCQNMLKFLNLIEIDKQEAANTIKKVRETAFKIRGKKKILIRNHISNS